MAVVSFRLPSVLSSLLKVPRSIAATGNTLDEALNHLCREAPGLQIHLFDESGALREHVLCFVNDTNSRDVEASNLHLRDGDRITILQAVSGGL